MSIFSRIRRKKRQEWIDAQKIYRGLMAQSRKPEFFGEGKVPDTFEGRLNLLFLHMSPVIYRLNNFGENGIVLSQAIYDVMVDDFDDALRGEGLADSGVSHRIKPMVRVFFDNLKRQHAAFREDIGQLIDIEKEFGELGEEFAQSLQAYVRSHWDVVLGLDIADLTTMNFSFAKFQ